METAQILVKQILLMLMYLSAGWALYKKGLVTQEGSRSISNLFLYLVVPSVTINSFVTPRTEESLLNLAEAFGLGALALGISMLAARLMFRKYPMENFAAAFSNAGFMGIPLITAAMGPHAVFYIAPLMAMLNCAQWTYGQYLLTGDRKTIDIKGLLTSPLIISLGIGLVIFLLEIPMPALVMSGISTLSTMTAPIAMLIVGFSLAQIPLVSLFKGKSLYAVSAMRLLVIPAILIAVFAFLPLDISPVTKAVFISISAPVGSNIAIYALRCEKDYGHAVRLVCLSTLFSLITLPVMVYLFSLV